MERKEKEHEAIAQKTIDSILVLQMSQVAEDNRGPTKKKGRVNPVSDALAVCPKSTLIKQNSVISNFTTLTERFTVVLALVQF